MKTIWYQNIGLCVLIMSGVHIVKAQDELCLKIGGSYYINCKNTIVFSGQPILSMTGDDVSGRMVSFELFSPSGKHEATLRDGKFRGSNPDVYVVMPEDEGFTIIDTRSRRVALRVAGVENRSANRSELHIWADLYLPDGNRFQCTPDETNIPFLNMLKGATFKNSDTAIRLD